MAKFTQSLYEKAENNTTVFKQKRNEALEEYFLLLKQLEQIQETISIVAEKLSDYEKKYTKAYLEYSELHRKVVLVTYNKDK